MAQMITLSVYNIDRNPQTGLGQVLERTTEAIPVSRIRSITSLSTEFRQGIPRVYAKVITNEADPKEYLTAETVAALVTAANT